MVKATKGSARLFSSRTRPMETLLNQEGNPLLDAEGTVLRKGATVRDDIFGNGIATGTVSCIGGGSKLSPCAGLAYRRTAFKLVQSHPASIRISSASQSTCVAQRMAGNWARSMGSLPRTTLASLGLCKVHPSHHRNSYGPMGRRGPPASKCRTTPSALMRGTTPGCCLSARECTEMETHLIQGHLSLSNQAPTRAHDRMHNRRLRRLHPGLGTPVCRCISAL